MQLTKFFFQIILLPIALSQFCQRLTPNSPSIISLQNCQSFYQLSINVGTPKRQYLFLIDTGSLWTWLPSQTCFCGNGIPRSSPTSNITNVDHSITYSDGDTVSGFEGSQSFSFLNTNFTNVNAPLVFVTQKRAPLMGDRGLVALGYSAENIFDSAYKQGSISTNTFILDLSDQPYQSKLYFDNLPSNILNNSVYSPIIQSIHLWAIKCYGVYVNGLDFSKSVMTITLVDSGTTLTTLNHALYKDIPIFDRGLHCPPSTKLHDIQFYLQGSIVFLDPEHYTLPLTGGIHILLASGDNIILGTSFFKNYAVTFDKKQQRIGFHGKYKSLYTIGNSFFYGSSIAMLAVLTLLIVMVFFSIACRSYLKPSSQITMY